MTRKTQWIVFAVALPATIAYWLCLQSQGASLSVLKKLPDDTTTAELPGNILAFEFAGSGRRASEIVKLWSKHDLLEIARDQIRLDFIFLLLYPTAIAFGCLLARRHLGQPSSRYSALGRTLAKAQVLAAGFDALENWAMLRILGSAAASSDTASPAPGLATWAGSAAVFATLKFGLVLAGACYAVAGFVCWLGSKVKVARQEPD